MTQETIVAVYDTAAHAEAAVADLRTAGVPDGAIGLHAGTGTAAPVRKQGFWASLFGGEPDHDTAVYDRSLEGGSTVVSVTATEEQVVRVLQVLERHHPIDVDERASGYGLAPTTARGTAAPAAGGTLQLSEESLAVGKRVVNRGGTRVHRYVVETPVEQTVTLHDERVVLERRPVNDGRPVGADEFSDRTIEMTESTEEAIVAKTAHVYEEVGLRKEATDRTETIRDTLRREEVEVETIPGTGAPGTAAQTPPALKP